MRGLSGTYTLNVSDVSADKITQLFDNDIMIAIFDTEVTIDGLYTTDRSN